MFILVFVGVWFILSWFSKLRFLDVFLGVSVSDGHGFIGLVCVFSTELYLFVLVLAFIWVCLEGFTL